MRLRKGPPDFMLLIITICLIGLGLVMVFSASAVKANVEFGNSYLFVLRQTVWAIISFIIMIIIMKLNYLKLRDFAIPLLVIAILGLIAALSPLGFETKGSSRWLQFGPIRFTPSEFAKLAMVYFLARNMEINYDKIRNFTYGIVPYVILLALVGGLVMLQPDLGTAFVISGTVFFMLLVAGVRWSHLGILALGGIGAVVAAIALAPYRMERMMAFMNPWKYASDEGFQVIQSLYALGSGGLFGMGLGMGRQKFFYLPEPYNDFIFAIIGEELGFLGISLVLTLFVLFAWRGFRIAINAPDIFGSLLAAGITTMIIFQASINMGVVCGVLPVTGITLPFISYGGSSLLFTMMGVGLLLNISRYSTYK